MFLFRSPFSWPRIVRRLVCPTFRHSEFVFFSRPLIIWSHPSILNIIPDPSRQTRWNHEVCRSLECVYSDDPFGAGVAVLGSDVCRVVLIGSPPCCNPRSDILWSAEHWSCDTFGRERVSKPNIVTTVWHLGRAIGGMVVPYAGQCHRLKTTVHLECRGRCKSLHSLKWNANKQLLGEWPEIEGGAS